MNALEPLLQQELIGMGLECARIAGLIITSPLAWARAPNQLKVGLVLMLALLVHGQGGTLEVPADILTTTWAVVTELGLGIAMGFVVRCLVAVAEVCGDAISPLLGLGVAHVFDASGGGQQVLLSAMFRNLAILVALVMGIHRIVLSALLFSFQAIPVGHVATPALAFPSILQLTADVLEGGVRLALPAMAILFMTQLALAFVARAAPQLQIFSIGFAVTLAVGLTILVLLLPDMARGFAGQFSWVESRLESTIRALGTTP